MKFWKKILIPFFSHFTNNLLDVANAISRKVLALEARNFLTPDRVQ